MKIQYASDLHLEFSENNRYILQHPFQKEGGVLVLAGDIGYIGESTYIQNEFWDKVSAEFDQVIVVPGNHEFYNGYDLDNLYDGWEMKIRDNVVCCYNKVIHLAGDVDLIASTLWAHIEVINAWNTERYVTDFHRIHAEANILSWNRFNKEHERCVEFIKKGVSASKAKHIVVATHHVPSFMLMADEFKRSTINGAFTAELGNYIADSRIECWIYGHSHRNIDGIIGNTRCVCNQLGYVAHGENRDFSLRKYIEV